MIYEHNTKSYIIMWFGGDAYEGLCGRYTFQDGVLKDGDGQSVKCDFFMTTLVLTASCLLLQMASEAYTINT